MHEFMFELKKHPDNVHSLVFWQYGAKKEFVVCSYYDENKEMGSRWESGHYFQDIEDAIEYFQGL